MDDAAGEKALRRLARLAGIHILAASLPKEDAVGLDAIPHDALTYLLLEAIRGPSDGNSDGSVSVQEIIRFVGGEMPLVFRKPSQSTISQNPVGYSRGVDFALARLPDG